MLSAVTTMPTKFEKKDRCSDKQEEAEKNCPNTKRDCHPNINDAKESPENTNVIVQKKKPKMKTIKIRTQKKIKKNQMKMKTIKIRKKKKIR